jgi:hypothetical protein
LTPEKPSENFIPEGIFLLKRLDLDFAVHKISEVNACRTCFSVPLDFGMDCPSRFIRKTFEQDGGSDRVGAFGGNHLPTARGVGVAGLDPKLVWSLIVHQDLNMFEFAVTVFYKKFVRLLIETETRKFGVESDHLGPFSFTSGVY